MSIFALCVMSIPWWSPRCWRGCSGVSPGLVPSPWAPAAASSPGPRAPPHSRTCHRWSAADSREGRRKKRSHSCYSGVIFILTLIFIIQCAGFVGNSKNEQIVQNSKLLFLVHKLNQMQQGKEWTFLFRDHHHHLIFRIFFIVTFFFFL